LLLSAANADIGNWQTAASRSLRWEGLEVFMVALLIGLELHP
jgi:hypothetical protein